MSVKITKLVSQLLQAVERREQEVLEGRYGIKDGAVRTLAEIGDQYSITRERVRQIESLALHKVQKHVNDADFRSFVNLVKEQLKNQGGVRSEEALLSDVRSSLGDSGSTLGNKVRFLLEVSGEVSYSLEDNQNHAYWYLTADDQKRALGFVSKLVKGLEGKREEMLSGKPLDAVLSESSRAQGLKESVGKNYLSLSKRFHTNQYGDFGLSHWPEINPKTVRDWSYLVLKKSKKPSHFEDIAKMINQVRKNNEKMAHPQTVHNELIKDPRFVLVGRGTYGLQEVGNMPGTAKEVIAKLLQKNSPMKPKDALDLVVKERIFKKNTVFINLQNRKHFKRLEDGRYNVHEA